MTSAISSQETQSSYRTLGNEFLPPKKRQRLGKNNASTAVPPIDSQVESQKFGRLVQAINEFAKLPGRLPLWPKAEFDEYMTEYMKDHLQEVDHHDIDAFIELHRDRALSEANGPEYSKMASTEEACFADIMQKTVAQYKKERGDSFLDRGQIVERVQGVFKEYSVVCLDKRIYDSALQSALDTSYGKVVSLTLPSIRSSISKQRIVEDGESIAASSSASKETTLSEQMTATHRTKRAKRDDEDAKYTLLVEAIKEFKGLSGKPPIWPKLVFNEHVKEYLYKEKCTFVPYHAFSNFMQKHRDRALVEAGGPAYATMRSQVECYTPLMIEAVRAHEESTEDDSRDKNALAVRIANVFKKYHTKYPAKDVFYKARESALRTIYGRKINLAFSTDAPRSLINRETVVIESTAATSSSEKTPLSAQTTAVQSTPQVEKDPKMIGEQYKLLVAAIAAFKVSMGGLPLWPKREFDKSVKEYLAEEDCNFSSEKERLNFIKNYRDKALRDVGGPSYSEMVASREDAYEPLMVEAVRAHKAKTGVPFKDNEGLTMKVQEVFAKHGITIPSENSYYVNSYHRAFQKVIFRECRL